MIAHNNQFVKKETKQKYSKNWPYDVKDGLSPLGLSRVIMPPLLPNCAPTPSSFTTLVAPGLSRRLLITDRFLFLSAIIGARLIKVTLSYPGSSPSGLTKAAIIWTLDSILGGIMSSHSVSLWPV